MNIRFSLGSVQKNAKEPDELQAQLLNYYSLHHPHARVQPRSAIMLKGRRNILSRQLTFYNYFILDGRRVLSSDLGMKASNSLVQTRFNNCYYVGQVTNILTHRQAEVPEFAALAQVKWFVPYREIDEDASPWRN